jgi:hypothetical protein
LATGLGSVNAANLVKNWSSVSFAPTATTLSLSTTPATNPITLTHGQPVTVSIQVAPQSGAGTPTGDLSLIAQTSNSQGNSPTTGIGSFALSQGSFSGTTNMLPGGSYGVTAHYAGNGTYGASNSTPPLQVTVNAENSQTRVALLTFDPVTGLETSSNATSVVAQSSLEILRVDVTNSSGLSCFSVPYPCPTGQVTLTDNGQPLDLGTYRLNSQGYTEDQLIQLAGGPHNVVASYSGDSSYTASTSPTDAITITLAPTTTTLTGLPSTAVGAGYISVTVTVNTTSHGAVPTGVATFLLNGSTVVYAGGDISGNAGSATSYASQQEYLSPYLPLGHFTIAAQYPGDSNYAGSTSPAVSMTITDFSVSVNPTSVNIPAPGQSGTATLTITPLYGFTGPLNLNCYPPMVAPGISCTSSPPSLNLVGTSPVTATLTITTTGGSSATPPVPQRRVPPSFRLRVGWPWLLAGLLALAALVSLATARRRPVGWLFATALLVVGVWAACGGGGGGGGSPPPAPAPIASFSPPSLAFGQELEGSTGATMGMSLSNTGNAVLSISSIAISGTNVGDFAQTNDCLSSLAPGANCGFIVAFTPTAAGARSASLTIADNASGSPQTVSLTGTGVAPATTISLSPSSLTFGQVGAGLTSVAQTVTLANTGNGALSISSITIGATGPPYQTAFGQTNNCGSSLAAGANCTISVTFTPSATGPYSASLLIADNAYGSPQTVSLTGTGVTPPGTYSFFVGAGIGSDTHTVPLTVTVQ